MSSPAGAPGAPGRLRGRSLASAGRGREVGPDLDLDTDPDHVLVLEHVSQRIAHDSCPGSAPYRTTSWVGT